MEIVNLYMVKEFLPALPETWVRCESVGCVRDFSVLVGLRSSANHTVNFIDENLHAAEHFRALLQARGLILMLSQRVEQVSQ